MLHKIIAFTAFVLFVTNAHAANLYKCQAADGKYLYSDKPCVENTKTIYKKKSAPNISGSVGRGEFVDTKATEEPAPDQAATYIFRARFVSVVASLTPVKMAAVEYLMLQGKWPKNLQDLGLDPRSVNSSLVDQVKIKDDGVIVATLDQSFGKYKKIVLTPKTVMGGTHVEWHCASNFTRAQLGDGQQQICESRKIY